MSAADAQGARPAGPANALSLSLPSNVKVDVPNKFGFTALMVAAQKGYSRWAAPRLVPQRAAELLPKAPGRVGAGGSPLLSSFPNRTLWGLNKNSAVLLIKL